LARRVASKAPENVTLFVYAERLLVHLRRRMGPELVGTELRSLSAQLITPEDVATVDSEMTAFVNAQRGSCNVIVDSHAVTKESYGYRITPFGAEVLNAIRPSIVCLLYARPELLIARISADPAGRPRISEFEADLHLNLQAAVAVAYAVHAGVPMYVLDAERSVDDLADELLHRLRIED
jgi:adenylate kinase